jgi:biopolymer transport protein ExbD
MAKKKRVTHDVGINLTPMIDIVFQLILFFMVTSQFASADIDPRVKLPELDDSRTIKKELQLKTVINMMVDPREPKSGRLAYIKVGPLNITRLAVGHDGGEFGVLRELLQEQIDRIKKQGGEANQLTVILRAHADLAFGPIHEVFLTVSQLGITDIGLAGPVGDYYYRIKGN